MKAIKLFSLVALAGCSALQHTAHAATYYVDRSHAIANDGNSGSATQPFKTISRGAQVARAGDTVIVAAGTYNETVQVANSGTQSSPITLQAKGTVIVHPTKTDYWSGAMNVMGKSDVIIAGFTVENAYYGIKVDADTSGRPANRVTVRNNHARYTRSSGLRVAFSTNITVESNVVEKTNWGNVHEMISVIGTNGFLVKNNEVFNGKFVYNGTTRKGKEGIDVKNGSSNGKVINNRVHDLDELGIYVDAWDKLTQNIEIVGNTIFNCRQGIAVASERGGKVKSVLIANNVAHHNRYNGIIVASWVNNGPREDIRILNNTTYGNGSSGIFVGTNNIYNVVVRNNISADNKGAAMRASNVGLITAASNNLVSGRNAGNILSGMFTGDPRFVGATSGNFRLGSGSAAANKGSTISQVPVDIEGVARPRGGAYDIGAFESQ